MSALPPSSATARSVDVDHERRTTSGASKGHHFNAAGAALPSAATVGAVTAHLAREEELGGYEAAAQMREQVDAVYRCAARLIGAQEHEIALFDSATTGLRVFIDALRVAPGQRIIASRSTYVSHALHLLTIARERGVPLVVAPVDQNRCVDLDALEELLADGVPSLVTIAHIPTSSGLVEPAAAIGALVARYGGTFVLDATQSVGHLVSNVDELGCDILVTTGRKFLRGPRGTGFAYVRGTRIPELLPTAPDVRGATWSSPFDWELTPSARRFESWEASVAARLGLGAAIEEAVERGTTATQEWLLWRGQQLRDALAQIPGVSVADPEGARSAIVTFVVEGQASADVVSALASRSVRVVSVPQSHGQWDLGDRAIANVVRASPHVYNDDNDVEMLIDSVRACAEGVVRS